MCSYDGSLRSKEALQNAVKDGPKSIEYTKIVEWLSKELKVLGKLEDHINAISSKYSIVLFEIAGRECFIKDYVFLN